MDLFLLAVFFVASSANAWDQHHFLTEQALAPMESSLSLKVKETRLEDFVAKNFPGCTTRSFFDRVLGGVGSRYQVSYPSSATARLLFSPGSEDIITDIFFHGEILDSGGHALPWRQMTAYQILSLFSDEPDWNMDSDVPELNHSDDLGATLSGTSTQLYRHFLFEKNETVNKYVETRGHTDRVFRLALAALGAGDEYWGFRFLAQALHYVQDLTQPFHVKFVPTYAMVNTGDVLSSVMCDAIKAARRRDPAKYSDAEIQAVCNAQTPSEDQAVFTAGLDVMSYHQIYEGYARQLFMTRDPQVASITRGTRSTTGLEVGSGSSRYQLSRAPLVLGQTDSFPDIAQFAQDVSDRTRPLAFFVGYDLYRLFGSKYKDPAGVADVLNDTFTSKNPGAVYVESGPDRNARLYRLTLDLMGWSGEVSRQFVRAALTTTPEQRHAALSDLQSLCH